MQLNGQEHLEPVLLTKGHLHGCACSGRYGSGGYQAQSLSQTPVRMPPAEATRQGTAPLGLSALL